MLMLRRVVLWTVAGLPILLLIWAMSWKRDDSTQAVRYVFMRHLQLRYEDVPTQAAMSDLGVTEQEFLEIIEDMEERFSTTIDTEDDLRLAAGDDRWQQLRIVDLADMVRPEWSGALQERSSQNETNLRSEPAIPRDR